jgi:hypothetical protein
MNMNWGADSASLEAPVEPASPRKPGPQDNARDGRASSAFDLHAQTITPRSCGLLFFLIATAWRRTSLQIPSPACGRRCRQADEGNLGAPSRFSQVSLPPGFDVHQATAAVRRRRVSLAQPYNARRACAGASMQLRSSAECGRTEQFRLPMQGSACSIR